MFRPGADLTHCYGALPPNHNLTYAIRETRKLLDNYVELHGSCRNLKAYIMKALVVFTTLKPFSELRRPRTPGVCSNMP